MGGWRPRRWHGDPKVAGKILPNTGNAAMNDPGPRFKAALSSFGASIFWVIVATIFPYPVLIPYWPEAVAWAPLALYFLAFFNLLKAAYHASRAVRLKQPNRPAQNQSVPNRPAQNPPGTSSSRAQEGVRARKADRQDRNNQAAEYRASNDDGRNRALPRIDRAPTVKRMR